MIYVTGDCHGDWDRFSADRFPDGKEMTKDDFVIICGDFGLWHDVPQERWWLDWLDKKPWTTLFVDGNHENFDRLDALPVEEWNGGKIHRVRPSILHLMRGQVFQLQGKTFWAFGGAKSHDIRDGIIDPDATENWLERAKQWQKQYKQFRIKHYSWWPQELPEYEEMKEGFDSLDSHNGKVDFIITHCAPTSIVAQLGFSDHTADPLTDYLDIVKEETEYGHWFFGHYHDERNFFHENATLLYFEIERIV